MLSSSFRLSSTILRRNQSLRAINVVGRTLGTNEKPNTTTETPKPKRPFAPRMKPNSKPNSRPNSKSNSKPKSKQQAKPTTTEKKPIDLKSAAEIEVDFQRAEEALENMVGGRTSTAYHTYFEALLQQQNTMSNLYYDKLLQMKQENVKLEQKTAEILTQHFAKFKLWKDVLRMMDEVRRRDIVPTSMMCKSGLFACSMTSNWTYAQGLLKLMDKHNVKLDVFGLNSYIIACERGGQTDLALSVLESMEAQYGVKPNAIGFSAVITSMGKGKNNQNQALQLLANADKYGIKPDVVCFNAAISACNQMSAALDILENKMPAHGVEPNVISYTAAIDCCCDDEVNNGWVKGMELLDRMERNGIAANRVTFTILLKGVAQAGQVDKVFELLEIIQARKFEFDLKIMDVALSACGQTGDWEKAIQLMGMVEEHKLMLDNGLCSRLLQVLSVGEQWEAIISYYDKMRTTPHMISMIVALTAAEKLGLWTKALDIFSSMSSPTHQPNYLSLLSVMRVCHKSQQYSVMISLNDWLKKYAFQPSIEYFDLTLDACSEIGNHEMAFKLLMMMMNYQLEATPEHFHLALKSCRNGKQWKRCYDFFNIIITQGLLPQDKLTFSAYKTVILSCSEHGKFEQVSEIMKIMKKNQVPFTKPLLEQLVKDAEKEKGGGSNDKASYLATISHELKDF
jgi:pentatricopeptide repeat domain-containing protein 1